MLDFSVASLVKDVGEVCLARNSLTTLARAFGVAKPIVSLEYKGASDGSDTWISNIAVEGCEWPRLAFAKVDLLAYFLEKRPRLSILDFLDDGTPDDTYIHSFAQDLLQPFPVYTHLEDHSVTCYKYFAQHLIDKFVCESPKKVFRVAAHSMLVRLDVLSLDELKEVLKKAPDSMPIDFIDDEPKRCVLSGKGGIAVITDNPSSSLIKQMSSDDSAIWLYVDHDTQHLAGRIIEFRITE